MYLGDSFTFHRNVLCYMRKNEAMTEMLGKSKYKGDWHFFLLSFIS